jgi:hypothetical protein
MEEGTVRESNPITTSIGVYLKPQLPCVYTGITFKGLST